MSRIDDYRRVATPGAVDFILKLAEQVQGRRFLAVTGGRLGGGAAEALRTAVPILSELGVDTRWEVTGGDTGLLHDSALFTGRARGRGARAQ
jgi:trehalose synthase